MEEEEILSEADKQRQHEIKMAKLREKERFDRREVRLLTLAGLAVLLLVLTCGGCNAYLSSQCLESGGSYGGFFSCEVE